MSAKQTQVTSEGGNDKSQSGQTAQSQPKLEYTLLDELPHDQLYSCPEEFIFGRVLPFITGIDDLGRHLGFTPAEIEEFRNYDTKQVPAQALKMLVTWREREGDQATVIRILEALQAANIPEQYFKNSVIDYLNGDSDSD